MLEEDETKRGKLLDTLKKHATTEGGDYLQADWYAYYAAIDPEVALSNNAVLGGLMGTMLDYAPGPKYDKAVNLTDRADYQPHYNSIYAEYAILPSDRHTQDGYIWQRAPT
jgi:hypothetical protein